MKDSNAEFCQTCVSQPCVCELEAIQPHLQDDELQILNVKLEKYQNALLAIIGIGCDDMPNECEKACGYDSRRECPYLVAWKALEEV